MKKILFPIAACIFSFQATASMNMDINAGYSGAYVTVTENGEALSNIEIKASDKQGHSGVTNDQGFVFVPVHLTDTRLITFTATNTKGESISKEVFISDNDFSTTTNRNRAGH